MTATEGDPMSRAAEGVLVFGMFAILGQLMAIGCEANYKLARIEHRLEMIDLHINK